MPLPQRPGTGPDTHPAYTPSSRYSVLRRPGPSTLQDPSPSPAFPWVGAVPSEGRCPPPPRPSAASTRTVMASSASQTFGRHTPSWVSAFAFPCWQRRGRLLTPGEQLRLRGLVGAPLRKHRPPGQAAPVSLLPCSHLRTHLPCTGHSSPLLHASPRPVAGKEGGRPGRAGRLAGPCPSHAPLPPGKVSVPEEELDAMLQEGKGPINFTVFLTLFGEKLNGQPGGGGGGWVFWPGSRLSPSRAPPRPLLDSPWPRPTQGPWSSPLPPRPVGTGHPDPPVSLTPKSQIPVS